MLDLASVTAETFRPHVGSTFTVAAGGATVEISLLSVVEVATHVPLRRRGFTLTFGGGDPARILPQATYLVRHAELGEMEIFVVPRTPVAGEPRYDADFS